MRDILVDKLPYVLPRTDLTENEKKETKKESNTRTYARMTPEQKKAKSKKSTKHIADRRTGNSISIIE